MFVYLTFYFCIVFPPHLASLFLSLLFQPIPCLGDTANDILGTTLAVEVVEDGGGGGWVSASTGFRTELPVPTLLS